MQKNKLLALITAALAFLYALSFFIRPGKDTRRPLRTALMNPSHADSVTEILLSKGEETLLLSRTDGLWLANGIPADTDTISSFITDLTKVRNMYEISDKNQASGSFGLSEQERFSVSYSAGADSYELFFGGTDFSGLFRFVMTSRGPAVYELDTLLDRYLSLSVQFWSDPMLISRHVLGDIRAEDVMASRTELEGRVFVKNQSQDGFFTAVSRLLELRHGGAASETVLQEPVLCITLELGNTDTVRLELRPDGDDFSARTTYTDSSGKKAVTFTTRISAWTYNRIREIML